MVDINLEQGHRPFLQAVILFFGTTRSPLIRMGDLRRITERGHYRVPNMVVNGIHTLALLLGGRRMTVGGSGLNIYRLERTRESAAGETLIMGAFRVGFSPVGHWIASGFSDETVSQAWTMADRPTTTIRLCR